MTKWWIGSDFSKITNPKKHKSLWVSEQAKSIDFEVYKTAGTKAPYLALRTKPYKSKKGAPTKVKMLDGTIVRQLKHQNGKDIKKGKWRKVEIVSSGQTGKGTLGWAHKAYLRKVSLQDEFYKIIVSEILPATDKPVTKDDIADLKPYIKDKAITIFLENQSALGADAPNKTELRKQLLDSIEVANQAPHATPSATGAPGTIKYLVFAKYGEKEKKLIKSVETPPAPPPEKAETVIKEYTLDKHLEDLKKLRKILSKVSEKIEISSQEKGRYVYQFDQLEYRATNYLKTITDLIKPFQDYIDANIRVFDTKYSGLSGRYDDWASTPEPAKKKYITYSYAVSKNKNPQMYVFDIHYKTAKDAVGATSEKDHATHEVYKTSSDMKAPYLALRTGPSKKKSGGPTLVQMPDGTRVRQLKKNNGKDIKKGEWLKVEIVDQRSEKGKKGWAHSGFLKKASSKSVDFWAPWSSGKSVDGAKISKIYDSYYINIIFHIDDIIKTFSPQNIDETKAEEFVTKYFINPELTRYPTPAEAKRVYNNGKINYKNQQALAGETLNDQIKKDIHEIVKYKYQNTSDQAFLSMIKNVSLIKTVEDIYERVLYAIPVSEIIKTVAECLMKQLSLPDLKAAICDNILKDIDEETLNKVLEHLGTSQYGVAKIVKDKIEKIMKEASQPMAAAAGDGVEGAVYNQAMGDIIASSVNSIDEKDALCVAILAIAPVALLSALGLVDLDLERGLLLNPAKHFLQSIQNTINSYSITGLTSGWKDLINQLIDDLIEEFIVKTIQTLLTEIAHACEGSSKADMSGMPSLEGSILPPSINDMPPTFPFMPFDLTEHLRDTGNDDIYPDLIDLYLDPDDPSVSPELIKDFLNDLTEFLTISELCTLFNADASDLNRKYIIDKIWTMLLGTEKYASFVKLIGNVAKLEQFFSTLGSKIDQQYCIDKSQALEATKKLLSDICGPVSNGALIEGLKDKISQDLIDDMLEQEKDAAKDTLDALLNLADPSRITKQMPPLFCGPDSKDNLKAPLFDSHQHDSSKYLTEKFLKQIIAGISIQFEQDLTSYKGIFLSSKNEMVNVIGSIPGAMAEIYSLEPADFNKKITQTPKKTLNTMLADRQYIAQKVHTLLSEASSAIIVSGETNNNFLKISATSDITDEIASTEEPGFEPIAAELSLEMNYGTDPYTTADGEVIEPGTSKIFIGQLDNQSNPNLSPYNKLVDEVINSFDSTNIYDDQIKDNVVSGLEFYAHLLNSIIVEHAEFITTQDLFKKTNFEALTLKSTDSNDPCAKSLLFPDNILQKIEEYTEALECKKEFSDIPAAYEVAQINLYVEILFRLILIEQLLKSIFVFAAYDINALLPEDDFDNSFYYNYIYSQVQNRLDSLSSLSPTNINVHEMIAKYSTQVYVAIQDLDIKFDISQDPQIIEDTKKWLLAESFTDVRSAFVKKVNESIPTPFPDDDVTGVLELEFGNVAAGSSPPSNHVLSNLIPRPLKLFTPPPVISVELADRKFTTIPGFYSSNPRLQNGGFFIEAGYDFVPNYRDSPQSGDNWEYILDQMEEVWTPGSPWMLKEGQTGFESAVNMILQIHAESANVAAGYAGYAGGAAAFEKWERLLNFFTPNSDLDAATFGGAPNTYYFEKKKTALGKDVIESSSPAAYFAKVGKMSPAVFKNRYVASDAAGSKLLFPDVSSDIEAYVKTTYMHTYAFDADQAAWTWAPIKDFLVANKLFKRFTNYYSLNLLLVVPNNPGDILRQKYNDILKYTSADDDLSGFYDALSDKKYFIQDGDTLYFKLPLLTYYPFEENNPGLVDEQKINQLGKESPMKFVNIFLDLQQKQRFKDFTNIINYKDLLSYISLIVTEGLEHEYSDLNTLFDRTILTVFNALGGSMAAANRHIDPEFYQASNFIGTSALQTGTGDQDWVGIMLKALLKSLATMTDPTWQTPWFAPGPLTPFGIAAKLLDGLGGESEEGDDKNAIAESMQGPSLELEDTECPD